jgi:hypothetical protein
MPFVHKKSLNIKMMSAIVIFRQVTMTDEIYFVNAYNTTPKTSTTEIAMYRNQSRAEVG